MYMIKATCSMSQYPILFIRWVHPDGLSIYIVDLKYHDTGEDPGFQVRGAHLKKIAPSGGRRENCWGISCEKSQFYTKKSYFFQFWGRRDARRVPPPGSAPVIFYNFYLRFKYSDYPFGIFKLFFIYIMSLLNMCFIDRHDIAEILA